MRLGCNCHPPSACWVALSEHGSLKIKKVSNTYDLL